MNHKNDRDLLRAAGEKIFSVNFRSGLLYLMTWVLIGLLLAGCVGGQQAAASVSETDSTVSAAGNDTKEDSPDASHSESSNTELSAADLYAEILAQVETHQLAQMPEQYVWNYYGIDLQQFPDSFFAASEDATSAETIVFVRTDSPEAAAEIEEALQIVKDQKADEMMNYLPQQYALVTESEVRVSGNVVYLIISEQEKAIRQIIEAGI